MHINHNSPVPLYYQLREQIRDNILSEKWKYGKELPTEMQLCSSLELSRFTVKQALDDLVREGLIERQRGKGTFVVYKREGLNLFSDPCLEHHISSLGLNCHSRVLYAENGQPPASVSAFFDEAANSFACIHRIRYVSGRPFAIEQAYIPDIWAKNILKENLTSLCLNDYVTEINGFSFTSHKVNAFPALLTAEEKQYLDLEDSRLQLLVSSKDILGMRFRTIIYFQEKAVIYIERLIEADRVSVSSEYDTVNHQFSASAATLILPQNKK